jgi:hypothetical protein
MLSTVVKIISAFAMHFFYWWVATVGRLASCATVVELLGIAAILTLGLVAAACWIRSLAVPRIWRSSSVSSFSGVKRPRSIGSWLRQRWTEQRCADV